MRLYSRQDVPEKGMVKNTYGTGGFMLMNNRRSGWDFVWFSK